MKNISKSRLRKFVQAEIFDGVKRYGKYYEIFINPTYKEIEETINASRVKGVRGVISGNGDVLIWPVIILHDEINSLTQMNIDVDNFRFAYDVGADSWIIDLHQKWSFDEGVSLLEKYESTLLQFGKSLSDVAFYFGTDCEYKEYAKDESTEKVGSLKRLIHANVKTLNDFYDSFDYDFVDIGEMVVNVDDIVAMSYPRNEEYNGDFTPKDKNDNRWIYQVDLINNGGQPEAVPLIQMPNGKYCTDGDGNHRVSAAKYCNLSTLNAIVTKMVPKNESDESWEDFAKEDLKKYDDMVIQYRNMYDEYNTLMDMYFDNKTNENYNKYKEYEVKLNDFALQMRQFKEDLDKKEHDFNNK